MTCFHWIVACCNKGKFCLTFLDIPDFFFLVFETKNYLLSFCLSELLIEPNKHVIEGKSFNPCALSDLLLSGHLDQNVHKKTNKKNFQ